MQEGVVPAHAGPRAAEPAAGGYVRGAARIGISVKIIKTGGRSLSSDLVKLNLTPCPMTNCWPYASAAETGKKGASHTRSSSLSTGGTASRAWRRARRCHILMITVFWEVIGSPLNTAQTQPRATFLITPCRPGARVRYGQSFPKWYDT